MSKRSREVQFYFHRSAKDFDRLYHKKGRFAYLSNRLFRKALYLRAEIALQECLDCKAESVLDVGSGSGVNAVLFAEHGIHKVLGIDYAQGMIDLALTKRPAELASRVSYIHADFMTWDPMGEKFDCVVALGVFDYLDQPAIFLEKMITCSRKKLMFSAPGKGGFRAFQRSIRYRLKNCPLFFYSRAELEELLKGHNKPYEITTIGSGGFFGVLTLEE